jgi:ribosomal protein S18 acetylase RimI-like enzyme
VKTPTIVPISSAHARSFRDALDTVARERRFLVMLEAPPLELVAAFVRDNVANGVPHFVALVDAQVMGWADIVPSRLPAWAHCGTLGMGVVPEYRSQGVGRRLLEACIAAAWARKLTRIQLEVRADNEHAIRLYERQGFIREGIKRRAMLFDGEYFDAWQMALLRC